MKKLCFLTFLTFWAVQIFAQNSTLSPYSRYGIGDISGKGFGQNQALGGAGIALANPYHLNNINPASYRAMALNMFTLEIGASVQRLNLETQTENFTQYNPRFNYLSLGFAVTPFLSASFGLAPFSNVGYQVDTRKLIVADGDSLNFFNQYSGKGGLNQAYLGFSFLFFKRLSLGIHGGYVFGSTDQNITSNMQDKNDYCVIRTEKRNIYNDFHFDFGLQYSHLLGKEKEIVAGITYDNGKKLNAMNTTYIVKYQYLNTVSFTDTLRNDTTEKGNFELPSSFGVGLTFHKINQFTFSVDYSTQSWSSTKMLDNSINLKNSHTLSTGIEFIPDISSLKYFKTIRYRIGAYYTNTYLELRDNLLKQYGLTFGFGLPLKNSLTIFNLSFEIGQRGTTNNGLIKENYFISTLNITLHDIWFVKRKYR